MTAKDCLKLSNEELIAQYHLEEDEYKKELIKNRFFRTK